MKGVLYENSFNAKAFPIEEAAPVIKATIQSLPSCNDYTTKKEYYYSFII